MVFIKFLVMRHLFSPKKWFTLLELLITMVIFFMMITVVTSIFIYVYKTKGWLEARQTVIKESYFFLEKLQVMSKDYTIDYEEYRNRQQVGCFSPQDPQWNTTGHCTMMTYYGNRNTPYTPPEKNLLYFCTSSPTSFSPLDIVWVGVGWQDCLFDNTNSVVQQGSLWPILAISWFVQSYGQYATLFWDVLEDVDYVAWAVGDDDDIDLWEWPIAVYQTWTIYPQELYLISHDKQKRLLFRRKLIEQADYNNDWTTWDSEKLYTIQVLQLRWFDAGENHDFDAVNYSWVYNGVIETWACDYSLWFICNGESVSGAYADFRLPLDVDDGWQNLLTTDITISDWNIVVSPLMDPYLAWKQSDSQINPFFSIGFTAKLYGKNWSLKIPWDQMDIYSLKLQTTLSSIFR